MKLSVIEIRTKVLIIILIAMFFFIGLLKSVFAGCVGVPGTYNYCGVCQCSRPLYSTQNWYWYSAAGGSSLPRDWYSLAGSEAPWLYFYVNESVGCELRNEMSGFILVDYAPYCHVGDRTYVRAGLMIDPSQPIECQGTPPSCSGLQKLNASCECACPTAGEPDNCSTVLPDCTIECPEGSSYIDGTCKSNSNGLPCLKNVCNGGTKVCITCPEGYVRDQSLNKCVLSGEIPDHYYRGLLDRKKMSREYWNSMFLKGGYEKRN